jgi:hypothetical protein
MTSTSESSSVAINNKTYNLGLFSARLKGCIGLVKARFEVKLEIPVELYFPRLKNLFPGDPELEDIVTLSKIPETGEPIPLKSINFSEIEVAELRIIKQKDIGKPSKRKQDADYEEETGAQIVAKLPVDTEIALEYSSSLDLIFVKTNGHIVLRTVVVTNSDILA